MRMCHNARLLRVCMLINAFALSPFPHYDPFMLARSALSHPCLQHFDSMCASGCVMNRVQQGTSKASPPACNSIILQVSFTYSNIMMTLCLNTMIN